MGFPQHKKWISGLDYDGPPILGFLDFWLFDLLDFFFGQCSSIRHPKHRLHRRGRPAILRHVAVKK